MAAKFSDELLGADGADVAVIMGTTAAPTAHRVTVLVNVNIPLCPTGLCNSKVEI